jgi:hypothetical protein
MLAAPPSAGLLWCAQHARDPGGESRSRELTTVSEGKCNCVRVAQTPRVFIELDGWLRTRLRVLRLRQWRHGPKIYREMRVLGASQSLAQRTASLTAGWWGSARTGLKIILTVSHFDSLGVPKFA